MPEVLVRNVSGNGVAVSITNDARQGYAVVIERPGEPPDVRKVSGVEQGRQVISKIQNGQFAQE